MEAGCKNVPQPQNVLWGAMLMEGGFGLFRGSIFERKVLYSRLAWSLWEGTAAMSPQTSMGSPSETLSDGFLFPNELDEDTGDW